ncbi:hypothetical protein [Chryseobacterium sp. 2R14A]|uniref:hypothetical protein n=1 Tax=Chryseobacterium sp. 2R14A TaxID=3380353 RepID=UPI003CF9FE62
MENKKFYWKDVKITIMGKEIDCKPIEYIPGKTSMEFEGFINITNNEINDLMNLNNKGKKHEKISNYQKKKLWKKYFKTINK